MRHVKKYDIDKIVREPKVGDIIKLNWTVSYDYIFIVEVLKIEDEVFTTVKLLLYGELDDYGEIKKYIDGKTYHKNSYHRKLGTTLIGNPIFDIYELHIKIENLLNHKEKILVREYQLKQTAEKFGL